MDESLDGETVKSLLRYMYLDEGFQNVERGCGPGTARKFTNNQEMRLYQDGYQFATVIVEDSR